MDIEKRRCPNCGGELTHIITGLNSSAMTSFYCENCSSKKEKLNKKSKDFEIFVESLAIAHREFCLKKTMRDKIRTELYNNIYYREVWDAIIRSLEENYKRRLSIIAEQPPNFLKFNDDYKVTADKLLKWRKKYFGHYDENTLRNPEVLLEKNSLEDKEIGDFFDKIIKITKEYNDRLNLLSDTENLKNDISNKCKKWLDNFKKV